MLKTFVIDCHDREFQVAPVQSARQVGAAFLGQLNLDAGVAVPITNEKCRKRILDDLRRCANSQCSSLALFERSCPLGQRLDFSEKPLGTPKYVLAFRGQLHPPTDAIEQRHAEFGFKGVNLARRSRLAQVEPSHGPVDTASFCYRNKGTEVAKVHFR